MRGRSPCLLWDTCWSREEALRMWAARGTWVPSGSVEYPKALILSFLRMSDFAVLGSSAALSASASGRARPVAADQLGLEQIDGHILLGRLCGHEVPEAFDVLPETAEDQI
jgi:hypothetical protein